MNNLNNYDVIISLPLVFSHSDLSTKAVGLETVFPFFFGRPITVRPAPLGRPRFLIVGGIFITETLLSIVDNGFRASNAALDRSV